ncbi:hypothetical protein R6Q59_023690, partial [Mikania micrantha]
PSTNRAVVHRGITTDLNNKRRWHRLYTHPCGSSRWRGKNPSRRRISVVPDVGLNGPLSDSKVERVGTQTTRLTAEDQQEREASCDFDGVG